MSLGVTPGSVSTGARVGCGTLSFPGALGCSGLAGAGSTAPALTHLVVWHKCCCPNICSIPASSCCSGLCVCPSLLTSSGMTPWKHAALPQGHFGKLSTPRSLVGAVELVTTPFALGCLLLCFGLCPCAAHLAPGSASLLAHTGPSLQPRHSS